MTRAAQAPAAVRFGAVRRAQIEAQVRANRGLIFNMLAKYFPAVARGTSLYEECEAEGLLALMRAAVGFDPTRGVQFSTYACSVIINAIRAFLMKQLAPTNPVRAAQSLAPFMDPLAPVESRLAATEAREVLAALWPALKPRERVVLRMLFGEAMTLEQVGDLVDLTRERVRQIRDRALQKLREQAQAQGHEIPRSCQHRVQVGQRRAATPCNVPVWRAE